ncbi:Similar to Chitin synthase 8; acc. no. Q4P9K9 [Pyronema omphalodes CBS 100304]|uniref:chitin synthase n=1 Tax=Pyronema omphalodes (strain CBS 100304) TaxID=1076935 RepID=U4KXL0_PYROM|nr:Similar to Chitin synthase 8; acc. no. Q4P9K9 [Pyronema omphalodes CBS 100304]
MAQPSPQAQPSLPALPSHLQSDTHITAHLASRFHLSLPTATISSQAIVSLNTFTTPNVVGVELEGMANRMWKRLGGRGENQVAVFLGESGSGKTTLRSHLLSSLLAFTATPLSHKVSLFTYLFDTLTTTKSLTTPTASKAGLFLELQYDGVSQTLIGAKLLDHRLERSRVANIPTGERNFHILYYLLAGTSDAEKEHLGLKSGGGAGSRHSGDLTGKSGAKRWRYLGHPTQLKVGINDAEGFQHFKTALRKLEFPRQEIAEICQLLAVVLHIGQLEFSNGHATTAGGDESGAMEGGDSVVVVRNKDVLGVIAAFLGVSPDALETSLGYRTKTLNRERVTVMLDAKGARAHADELARTLYSLLVAYIIESCNERLCAVEDGIANTISIIDFPGFSQTSATGSTLDQLLNNAATESLYNFCLQSFFDKKAEMLESEEIGVAATSYFDNSDAVRALLKSGNGLLSILDDQTKRGRTDAQFLESLKKRFESKSSPAITIGSSNPLTGSKYSSAATSFTVKHYAGEVDYPITGLIEQNSEIISADLMNLFRGTTSSFVTDLFSSKAVTTMHHPREKSAIMQGQISSRPLRMPSVLRKKGEKPNIKAEGKEATLLDHGAAGQFVSALDTVTKSLTGTNTNPYFVFCLKPNDRRIANQFDSKCVRTQIRTLGIAEISQRVRNADFTVFLPFGEFLGMAEAENIVVGSEKEKAEVVVDQRGWQPNEARVGSTGVFLSEQCWFDIAQLGDGVRTTGGGYAQDPDNESNGLLTPVGEPGGGLFSGGSDSRVRLIPGMGSHIYGAAGKGVSYSKSDDMRSEAAGSAFNSGDMFRNFDTREQMAEKGQAAREEEVEELPVSGSRKRWMFIVWAFTWFVPNFLIRYVGRIKRKDVQLAWREKLAINLMIWLLCGISVFFLVVFPNLICPKQNVFTMEELSAWNGGKNGMEKTAYTAVRGVVFDLTQAQIAHYPAFIPQKNFMAYGGKDATGLFPIQVSALCNGADGKQLAPQVQLNSRGDNYTKDPTVDRNSKYHDFRWFRNDSRPDWYLENIGTMMRRRFKKGNIGYSMKDVLRLGKQGKDIAVIGQNVYDLTEYNQGGRRIELSPDEKRRGISTANINTDFLVQGVTDLFSQRRGEDITQYWEGLGINKAIRDSQKMCLDRVFFIGVVDTRNSVQCQFARYLLLAISIVLVSVIGFKFFAALQFTRKRMPENLDKFMMCQVPAYTEDEESLRRAIDSVAKMRYDDKRKLLIVVCDGMIVGQGNDRPTPRIVLDILGVPETVDPEPLSFESLGEGQKRHNMGKIYSGLYEVQGHIVPFMVVVKVGKPTEVSRPGNRGKRDSQMCIMRFLSRVHYNEAMSPMELEMHHQIRNIIGVNPTFYEFILQIDADTVVAPDSGTRMVASLVADTRIIALCGETGLNNAKHSFITMIQVYEYFISHNLSKAFESLFGSVTCLPGCFSMYRIRAAETGKALFVSREIIEAYSENRVDTLHMKNLLHLGEDRYLTTLLLKHHPSFKTKFIFDAHAWTIAPDSWSVFLSQRRRWINSTIHNLAELVPMQQLCGFCCFSMRFVVFLDLLSTIIAPVTVGYLCYLIYMVATESTLIPLWAFVLLAAVYGLQAIIFIFRRKWEMIGWMILYIIAIPVFSLALPLYSFWHMDDFSWGNTRVVTGEKGQKVVISDEGKFDISEIPHKKWEEFQNEMWEAATQRGADDTRSEASGYSYGTKSYAPNGSEYAFGGMGAAPGMGGMGMQQPQGYQSRPMSTLDLPHLRVPSRMSMAQSERSYSGNYGQQQMGMEMVDLPSDDAILAEIREILRTADLMTVTKKSIKNELEARFGVSLDAKRSYINSATEAILGGNL